MDQSQLNKIKEITEEFFGKMTVSVSGITVKKAGEEESVAIEINVQEPQILIGQQGQTLFEIQRILRMVVNKKLQKIFYINLDINGYKEQKTDYLRDLAKSTADHVALTKEEKSLLPMLPYERRIIHDELSKRADVATESRGEGENRHIVVKPK